MIDYLANRILRRNHYAQVHVVAVEAYLNEFDVWLMLAQLLECKPELLAYALRQELPAVFRNGDEVILSLNKRYRPPCAVL